MKTASWYRFLYLSVWACVTAFALKATSYGYVDDLFYVYYLAFSIATGVLLATESENAPG